MTNNNICHCCLVTKSCLTLCDPMDMAHQTPLSMGFPRQEYWSGLSFSSPGDLLNPGIKPSSPALAGGFFTTHPPEKPKNNLICLKFERRACTQSWRKNFPGGGMYKVDKAAESGVSEVQGGITLLKHLVLRV